MSSATDADAFERYCLSMTDFYDIADVDAEARRTFLNRTSVTLFEAGTVGRGRSSGQSLLRTPGTIRRSDVDAIGLIVDLGGFVADCDGRDVSSRPGDVHLRDLSRPSHGRLERVDLINVMVPRDRAPEWARSGDIHGLSLISGSPIGGLLTSHLARFAEVAADLTQDEGEAAIAAAFLIAERAFGRIRPLSPEQAAAIYRTVLHKAGRIIDTRLLDPDLTIESIARAAGVSRTTLYRAFEARGGVLRHIQNRRLDRARAALRLRAGRNPTIAEIAWLHGFVSEAHFSRLFRKRFGHSPAEVAPQSLVRSDRTGRAAGPIRHQDVIDWLGAAAAA
ncbi:hypothetical protein ASC65_01270 [Brevundimonas sp. Root1279]|nr:hypothetical protein ASC65_01270 [Brevundimonas sp. Root1279]